MEAVRRQTNLVQMFGSNMDCVPIQMTKSFTVRKIQKIQACTEKLEESCLRIAAYCRVSTEREEQRTSIQAQQDGLVRRIREHPGWKSAGVYVDEGLSGTNATNRPGFQRMIQDAKAGKIDRIITKSLSRFARNTLECIKYTRQLKKWGVSVLFEKENIDTGSVVSEMILTVMAAFAQEESRSNSENLKWGLRKGFENGQVRWMNIYGYRKEKNSNKGDAEWVIEPNEAMVVQRIFDMYDKGKNTVEITNTLNMDGIPSPKGKQWLQTVVADILDNEKYVGDYRAQKYISIDHLSHKSVLNRMEQVPSFYIENHHIPMIDREMWDRVVRIRQMRKKRHQSSQYPYGEVNLLCPCCGEKLVQRRTRHSRDAMLWCCFGENGCQGYALKTWQLNEAMLAAWRNTIPRVAPESVDYWWLDKYVDSIVPTIDEHIIVHWKNGKVSVNNIPIRSWAHEPTNILNFYKNYLVYVQQKKLKQYPPTE